MSQKIPSYSKYLLINFFLIWCYTSIFRFIFYFFYNDLGQVSTEEIKKAIGLGVRFDIKLSVLVLLPLALLVLIINQKLYQHKIYKRITAIYLTIAYVIITLFYFFDFGHYDYLDSRVDASSLRFLTDLKISIQVLFESYPIYKILLGLLIIIFTLNKVINYTYSKLKKQEEKVTKKTKIIVIVTTILLLAMGIYNSFTHYPLRWSQAFFSKNNKVNQLALNPVLYFFDSFKFRNEGVAIEETKKYYPFIAKQLNLSEKPLSFIRKETFENNGGTEKPNIVFVMLESLGVAPMSYFGNPIPNTTPKMDSIMKESVLFTNFFVHKSGTAASVFASITGLPDIDGVRTASRNPMIINQRIVFDQFKEYEKLYFLGGSANWANIRGVFQSNINGLKVFEEGSYEVEDRVDVWGIDDYDLFKEANKELEKQYKKGKPFVAYIQSASNHMPFTVPDQKESYRPLSEDHFSKETLKKGGFDGIERLNALRYLDFNVNKFLERAKASGYYDNTIFLFFGDHNTAMTSVPRFKKEFDYGVHHQHVPFFIHAPKYLKPSVISRYRKLVDLVPTAASLAKNDYINYTLGSNAMDTTQVGKDFAFVFNKVNGEPSVGVLKDGYYFTKAVLSKTTSLRRLTDINGDDVKAVFPKITSHLDSLAMGYYHATKYLYYNNKNAGKK